MIDSEFDFAVELSALLPELTPDRAVGMIRDLCAGLGEEFHGNIWPGNIRVEDGGRALLGAGSRAPVSARDAGQVEYLSPEFFWENDGTVTSDVYSLGLVLYAGCNDGYLPFQPKGGALTDKDRSLALRKRMKGENIPSPAGVSAELGAVLRKALAYEPEDRYASPAELRDALAGTLEALPTADDTDLRWGENLMDSVAAEGETEVLSPEKAAAGVSVIGTAVTMAAEREPGAAKEGASAGAPTAEAAGGAEGTAAEKAAGQERAQAKYTVQKDFEKTRKTTTPGSRAYASAAARKTKKKKTSPAIPILCVAALAVIGGGIWYGLTHQPFEGFGLSAETTPGVSEPITLAAETPEPTLAPAPVEEVHTGTLAELTGEAGEAESEAAALSAAGETPAPEVTGSAAVDGMDVTPATGTVYVTGSGVNLRSGPGTTYQVSTTLSRGTALARTGTVNGWTQVQYEGKEYYVSSSLVSEDNPVPAEGETQALESTPAPAGTSTTSGNSTTSTTSTANSTSTSTTSTTSGSNSGTGTSSSATSGTAASGTKVKTDVGEVVLGSGTLKVASDANIRSGPGTNYDKLGEAKAGTKLTATGLSEAGKWYRVTYDGKDAYVNRKMVSVVDYSPLTEKEGTLQVVSDANIRSGPGTGYDKLGESKAGTSLTMTGRTASNWYQVTYDGKTGYVAGNLVKET